MIYRKKDLFEIIVKGGFEQLDVAQEEMAELIKVISKIKRYGYTKENEINLIEEICDVQIMLNQLILMTNLTNEIMQDEMDCKIDRQLNHLKSSTNGLDDFYEEIYRVTKKSIRSDIGGI